MINFEPPNRPSVSRSDVSKAITAVLAPAGFRRRGTRWYHDVDDVRDVVSLITGKSGDHLSVEVGIFDPRPYRHIWPIPKTITEADCLVRADLAMLAKVPELWYLDDPDVASTIPNLVRDVGMPWLASMHSSRGRIEWLESRNLVPSETALLAMAELEAGDAPRARWRLTQLRTRVDGPWRSKVDELLDAIDGDIP